MPPSDVILADAMRHPRSALLGTHQARCPFSASAANSHASTRGVAGEGAIVFDAMWTVCSRVCTPGLVDECADLHQLTPCRGSDCIRTPEDIDAVARVAQIFSEET